MASRIEVRAKIPDARARVRKQQLEGLGFSKKITALQIVDVYTVDAELDRSQLKALASLLSNPITQVATVNESQAPGTFDWAIEVGFLPGVTDNIGHTARETVEDFLKRPFPPGQGVYSSQISFLSGQLSPRDAAAIAKSLANPLIHRVHIRGYDEFQTKGGMDPIVPKVHLEIKPTADVVNILGASDGQLMVIGKQGIADQDGTRRGPLALNLTYMKTIQEHFRKLGRNPTDVELESIAQTWSEHCKHTIFANPMDDVSDGLLATFIKGATDKIRRQKGGRDICVSVFHDNSGAILFDDDHLITHKVETHNSPSALDPFGGAITGIVGVNRDAIGFGLGAKPVVNVYGYCFADPNDIRPLYKGSNFTQKMLSPKMIMDGVIQGVNEGGNYSGIPTPQGFLIFDENYRGKPLVFVGTIGLIPKKSRRRPTHLKQAQPGDWIVMVGGRVGKDGIHGATFSSEIMDARSPAAAVQIGDPITQKKLSDAIVKEARDLGLYNSITDNGAGGLSCSVAEMARECGGCSVKLEDVPLKYPGLRPWEIWCSESQERMTLAVPRDNWEKFSELMERRGVEATIIGQFTDSGRCIVDHNGHRVMDLDMKFLHHGLPLESMHTLDSRSAYGEPVIPPAHDLTGSLHAMLGRSNIAGFEFVSQQYDHEVQGGSVIKPLQGRGRVNGDATVIRPLLSSPKGIAISQGIYPTYSQIDTYHMAACAIDTAIRNVVAVGADLDHLALLDNFCWCSSDEPERLGQLQRAARACYDYALAYGTPFVSGKDSMFNDFRGYDETGKEIKISVLPTLLISSIAVMADVAGAISLDAKFPGDLVYVLGETYDELGGSEYYAMWGHQRGEKFIGNSVPQVDAAKSQRLYRAFFNCIQAGLIASAQSLCRGGLAVALAKTALGGMLGMEAFLENLPGTPTRDDFALFSESQGRILATICPKNKEQFEKKMRGIPLAQIGTVTEDEHITIKGLAGNVIVKTTCAAALKAYKSTFGDY
jgi:phosphoribosylformylglycinamidine synthase II